jgi:hypothetical protein
MDFEIQLLTPKTQINYLKFNKPFLYWYISIQGGKKHKKSRPS